MIKRTVLLTTVFATLLSAALSVQAQDSDYYWTGARDNTYYFAANWNVNGAPYDPEAQVNPNTGLSDKYLDSLTNPSFSKVCHILTTSGTVTVDFSTLGVASLTVGNGIGGETGTATLNRGGGLDVLTIMTVNKGAGVTVGGAVTVSGRNNVPGILTVNGGTFNANNTTTISSELAVTGGVYNAAGAVTINNGGTLSIDGGKFNYTASGNFVNNGTIDLDSGEFVINPGSGSFRVGGANNNAVMNITGGEATFGSPVYIATSSNGTVVQSDGTATFDDVLELGWGDYTGTYNLSGGTLNTEVAAGLWNANSSGASTFNVTGGTANFNKTGESFTVGLGGTNQLANVFTLSSGTVNATDTFAIKYGGTLNVAKNGETGGDGVLNANKIEINNGGNLIMSSGTINLGAGGITSSGNGYSITLAGGTLATKGSDWSSALNANVQAGTETTFAPETGKTITWSGNFTNNSDRGTIRKTGAGTLAFNSTSDNAINANLTIDEGTVILNQSPGGGNRFASGVVVTVNSGGKLQCNIADSLGWGANAVTFKLYGGEFAMNVASNDTLTNKTFNLKGGSITTLDSVNSKFDIYGAGNAFNVEAETGATAQNPTTSYVKGWLRLRNTTDFNITVNENAKLVVDKNFGIYDNSESTKPLVKLGPGVLVFEGNNSYTQGTKISAGTLILTENGSLGTGAVVNEASLVFAHDSEQTFTNAVSGTGTVTKTGEGRLKINAANGFQASELIVSNGRLDFLGTMTGGITLSANTIFSPGNSVGTADINGTFTLESGATLLLEVDGSQSDLLKASSFDVASGIIDLQMGAYQPGRKYAIIQNKSGDFGEDFDVDFWTSLLSPTVEDYWKLSVENDTVYVTIDANAIPEPSTWLLLVLGTAGLLYWRKKK